MKPKILRKNPDKIKEEIGATSGIGGATNLSYNEATRVVSSSTGTDATLTLADGTNPGLLTSADFTKLSNTSGTNTGDNAVNSNYSGLAASKQDTLVSGTNIKTINSNSLLGSGNLSLADFSGPASSVDGEAVVFDGTTGKLGKRPTGTAKFPILGLAATTFGANEIPYSAGVGNELASTSSLTWNGTTLNATQFNGVALAVGGPASPTVATLASDQATGANVTPVTLTGLVFSYVANSKYRIWAMGNVQPTAATTGCGFQFDLSSAVTSISVQFFHQLASTGTLSGGHSIADDASVGVSSGMPATSTYPVTIFGLLVTGANAGTAQLRFRSETTAVTTCKAGFTLVVEKIA